MITTVIGSYPKPSNLKNSDWFKDGMVNRYYKTEEDSEEDILKALESVIKKQSDLGIDIITDGEVRRENYIHFFCRNLTGIDFENKISKILRNGAYTSRCPSVISKIESINSDYCANDFKISNKIAKKYNKKLKYTLPGPLTISDTLTNKFYKNKYDLCNDLANIIKIQIINLVKEGCTEIQIDEPVFARYPNLALDWGIELLNNITKGFENIFKTVHICCGYPHYLDQTDYKKADYEKLKDIIIKLDDSNIDAISIEDGHCNQDLSYLSRVKKKTIVYGVLAIANSRIESVEKIENRINEILKYIPKKRLIIAPDCGLGFLPENILEQKIKNMVEATKLFRIS